LFAEEVAAFQSLPEEDWRQEITKQAKKAIGEALWNKIQAQWRINNSLCGPLAEAARELLKLAAAADGDQEKLNDMVEALGWPSLVLEVANVLINRSEFYLFAPLVVKLRSTAHALRILGIFSCSVLGNLHNCECLKDLATDLADERFKDSLWNFLSTS